MLVQVIHVCPNGQTTKKIINISDDTMIDSLHLSLSSDINVKCRDHDIQLVGSCNECIDLDSEASKNPLDSLTCFPIFNNRTVKLICKIPEAESQQAQAMTEGVPGDDRLASSRPSTGNAFNILMMNAQRSKGTLPPKRLSK
jgi:hypothetical protein